MLKGDALVPSGCTINPISNGTFSFGTECVRLNGSAAFPSGYGKYRLDFSMRDRAAFNNGSPKPVVQIWSDGTGRGTFTIDSTAYKTYSLDVWARTDNHVISMYYANPVVYALNADGSGWVAADQHVDIESITITPYPDPPAPVVRDVNPTSSLTMTSADTLYHPTGDYGGIVVLLGLNSILDCQGRKIDSIQINADNVTVRNCVIPHGLSVWNANHATIQNNAVLQIVAWGGWVSGAPTTGHLIAGNTTTARPADQVDDPILLNDITDTVVSGNTIPFSYDIEIEGLGYWNLVTFDNNTFPDPSGAFIGGWYDNQRSQGFQMHSVTIKNNGFKASPSCVAWTTTLACGGTDQGDQDRLNTKWLAGITDVVFSGNRVIP